MGPRIDTILWLDRLPLENGKCCNRCELLFNDEFSGEIADEGLNTGMKMFLALQVTILQV